MAMTMTTTTTTTASATTTEGDVPSIVTKALSPSSSPAAQHQQHAALDVEPAEGDVDARQETTPPTTAVTASSNTSSRKNAVKKFIVENFIPLGFLFALVVALAFPQPGREVGSWQVGGVKVVQAVNNFLVFLVSGLTLRWSEFRALRVHWLGALYGSVAILAITPCLGFATRSLPLKPTEFATGLTIFTTVPTTLGVGVALVGASKGNQVLALFFTIATNLLGIVSVPYELRLLLNNSTVSVNPADLVVKLLLTVLVPTVIGKVVCSNSARVQSFVKRRRVELSLFSSANLVCIVWQTLSGARDVLVRQAFTHILAVIGCAAAVHVGYLLFNAGAVRLLRLPLVEAIAVVIMASQKSAPVAVTVISYVTTDIVQQGLLAVPAIVGQLTQIFLGSALAKVLAKQVDKESRD
eukprot:jgi/Chlat1/9016/Chrsp94S08290